MNVLFFESSIVPYMGGVERVTDLLYHYFEENDIQCYFVFYLVDNESIPSSRKMRMDIKGNKRENTIKYLNFIKENHIDIIINQDLYHDFLFEAYSNIKKNNVCKVVNCFHVSPNYFDYCPLGLKGKIKCFIYRLLFNKDLRYKRYRKMYDVSDKFVLLSHSFEKDFLRLADVKNASKLCAISNPLSFKRDSPINLAKKEKTVLIISRYHEVQKNLCAAMRIWKEIESRGTNGWKLVLGGYGPDEQMLMNYIQELQIEHIEILGKVKNPLPYYEKSSIFMMTSNFEGFSMTLTETMQNGCVPIVFDTFTSLHDIVTDSVDGIIISPNDEKRYADKLYELMMNDRNRDIMARKAIDDILRYNISSVGMKWTKLFNELMENVQVV